MVLVSDRLMIRCKTLKSFKMHSRNKPNAFIKNSHFSFYIVTSLKIVPKIHLAKDTTKIYLECLKITETKYDRGFRTSNLP